MQPYGIWFTKSTLNGVDIEFAITTVISYTLPFIVSFTAFSYFNEGSNSSYVYLSSGSKNL